VNELVEFQAEKEVVISTTDDLLDADLQTRCDVMTKFFIGLTGAVKAGLKVDISNPKKIRVHQ
jgi:hypothetical protein